MQSVIAQLKENIQLIHRKAIDADSSLNKLQQSGKGKFNYVFAEDTGFKVTSKRFVPYVEEVGLDIAKLEQLGEEEVKQQLPNLVKKMELMLSTLAKFQHSLKG